MTDPLLDRRTFLTRSALASGALVATASGVGCGAATPAATMPTDQTRELEARLARGLGRVRGVPRGDIARQLTWVARPDISENLLRETLESLVVIDVARSLPAGERVPEPLASALMQELPVLGRSTDAHHALLARMPSSARRKLDEEIQKEPSLPMDVAGWIDRHARELGTGAESRMKLRLAARDVQARLRHQSANAVIDDCVAKVERVSARSGRPLALARSNAATAMVDAIWQQVDGVPAPGGSGLAVPPPPSGSTAPPQQAPVHQGPTLAQQDMEWEMFVDDSHRFWSARWRRPGDEEIRIGSIMMPFGLLSCGLTLIIGIIVVIAGAVQNANWDGVPREGW